MRFQPLYLPALIACALGVGYVPTALPQASPTAGRRDAAAHATEPMRPLSFLVGKWQGKVRYETSGTTPPREVNWSADVRYNLGGSMLLIDERGSDIANPDSTTRAVLVVVQWDPSAKDYPGRLYFSTKDAAGSVEGRASVQGETFVLQTTSPTQITRYTLRLNEKGQWYEVGESSRDGGNSWRRFFEMTLTRQN